jgi:anti-anti-sigma regulatory factor
MESATKPAGTLMVAIFGDSAWVKISGRANFTSSIDLKNLVNRLWENGYRHLVFNVGDCVIMDSTFLGVLAGIGLNFAESKSRGVDCLVEIANPNARISDLLENLGVAHLFNVISTPEISGQKFESLSSENENFSRADVTRTCLEAHKTLMALSPANADKFKDVAQFLAEDLKKLEAKES